MRDDQWQENRLVFLGLVVGCLLTALSVCVIVGASVYAAEVEARQCAKGECSCETP